MHFSTDEKFDLYLNELLAWNKKFNLTSITTPEEIRIKHFEDSKTLSQAYDFSKPGLSVIDIGTGAGFPGIVLKLLFPEIKLTLLDSVKKKTQFLKHIVDVLGLKDVDVVWSRAEDYARDKRESFDVAVTRALADLRVSAELCLPLVKTGGVFIAMKSEGCSQEIDNASSAIKVLGGRIKEIVTVRVKEMNRKLVVTEKTSKTPEKYPRRPGMPQKRPL